MLWAVAVAGFFGAAARYIVDGFVQDRVEGVLPYGTLVVNLTGTFALGILTGLFLEHGLASDVRSAVGAGFLGSYTTFSTFAFETLRLAEDGARVEAALNVAVSVVAGFVAAAGGLALTGAL